MSAKDIHTGAGGTSATSRHPLEPTTEELRRAAELLSHVPSDDTLCSPHYYLGMLKVLVQYGTCDLTRQDARDAIAVMTVLADAHSDRRYGYKPRTYGATTEIAAPEGGGDRG